MYFGEFTDKLLVGVSVLGCEKEDRGMVQRPKMNEYLWVYGYVPYKHVTGGRRF